ncbi:TlpA family protein disulfide reductase [Dyadobacter frigoris]|uniref:Redoxin domain-containing protein n=1 Tax=Dyadobacter frigoris TaxID=2576211 RepID=A0A4U6CST5_9BACT|nr:TlpA family protein disulfide reductase [Dyadobacter frigoris]TKT85998.1 redoxin domain-containing protein [Dyadobacter frigoris]
MNSRFCSPGRILPYLFYFSLFYLLLWCWKPARGQSVAAYKPLQIGDTVPDVTINNILHYKTPTAKLSDFKGKLLILDFWATWCTPCVAMIPKMDSLQKQFEGKVQFLSVAYQSEKEVAAFMTKLASRRGERIPIPEVVGDKILNQLFYHNALPHYIWIDQDGIVKAVTGMKEVNNQNIESFLKARQASMAEKKDDMAIPYNRDKPFLIDGNGGKGENLIFHAAFTGFTEGLSNGYNLTRNKEDNYLTSKISVRNLSLPQIYCLAYGEGKTYLGKNRLIFETADSLSLTGALADNDQHYREWRSNHTFCYEVIAPPFLKKEIYKMMQQDLDRLIRPYKAEMKLRKTKFYALIRTSARDLLKSAGGPSQSNFDGMGCKLRNEPLSQFSGQLNVIYLQRLPYPFLNLTDYNENVDMEIQANMSSVESLNQALEKYDLKIVEQEGEIPMLVIENRIL